ncbi:hypothetical protein RclHR1_04290004 [Rhizophagus clarus]|uniref:Uncharacterized protein n=1 Tax=Rhizophagus clarus TaxID=94130 RepID=A0A2Z6RG40_9GLOM|nr:hypothetical protein RclHR1_04290004 [Rhizophagus clarus]GES92232.1 hypothetical protein GLOIN_2v1829585 [Rhizophagus clarus]
MFKLNELCFDEESRIEQRFRRPLRTMFKHYQSARWLLFWIFYSIHKDLKVKRFADAEDESNFDKFKNSHRNCWFVNELWDYKYVKDAQNLDRELYNAIIEYEMI